MTPILLYGSIFASLFSIYLFVVKKSATFSVFLLCGSAFLLRCYMATLDPFLHNWDERYHALVAKNMMSAPLTPMLRSFPVLPYDYTAWCCNHIWLHKQPLFMWQMALSMQVFGVNEIALRLPSALLSAAMVWWVFRIAQIWTKEAGPAYLAAFLCAFSNYQLELVSGFQSLDHNDIVFTAYVTASIWAFCEYVEQPVIRRALGIGLLAGLAILVKWLTGLLVFGAWGLYVLLDKKRRTTGRSYIDIGAAFVTSIAVMLPWQLYIRYAFPKESAWEYAYNTMHVTEVLGTEKGGNAWYYLQHWHEHYAGFLWPFMAIGIYHLFRNERARPLTVPMLSMALVVYVFFSIFVATKMISFPYIICSVLFTCIASGLYPAIQAVLEKIPSPGARNIACSILLIGVALFCAKPSRIFKNHFTEHPERLAKMNNTLVYKSLNQKVPADYVVINCKSMEDVELMFYQNNPAYHWWPEPPVVDSLLRAGYKLAAFQSVAGQGLPLFIADNPQILLIQEEIK